MKNKAFRFAGFCLVLLAPLLVTCDLFQEDLIQNDKQVVFNSANQSVYYILPNSAIVIDLKSIVKTAYTSVSLNVANKPQRGELNKLTDFIFKYEPRTGFIEGNDFFTYSVRSANGRIMRTDTVLIIMEQEVAKFPCSLYAVEDFASIKPGSNVSINFLDNERICGAEKESLDKLIYSQPQHGKATLTDDDVISYTASTGFEGWDQFVYKINAEVEGSVTTAFGLISILITEDPCRFVLNNDEYSFTVNSYTQEVQFDILGNDIICSDFPLQFKASIIQQPMYGTALPIEGGKIQYERTSLFTENYKDSLVYSLCYKGDCQHGVVILDFFVTRVSSCLDVVNDQFIDTTKEPLVDSYIYSPGYNVYFKADIPGTPCWNSSIAFLQSTSYSGDFKEGVNGEWYYIPRNSVPVSKNDTAKFRLCIPGECKDVTSYVLGK